MKHIVLANHYVVIDPEGEIITSTITHEKMIGICVHLADATPSSVKEKSLEAGYKLIKCDIVFTNITTVNPFL